MSQAAFENWSRGIKRKVEVSYIEICIPGTEVPGYCLGPFRAGHVAEDPDALRELSWFQNNVDLSIYKS